MTLSKKPRSPRQLVRKIHARVEPLAHAQLDPDSPAVIWVAPLFGVTIPTSKAGDSGEAAAFALEELSRVAVTWARNAEARARELRGNGLILPGVN